MELVSDKKNIVKNGFYSILQTIIAIISFAVAYLIVVKQLGKEQLGIWALISAIPSSLLFLGSSVSGCILRYFPIYSTNNKNEELNKLFASGLAVNLTISSIIVVLGILFQSPILCFLFNVSIVPNHYLLFFKITLITFLLNFLSAGMLVALDGLQLMKYRNFLVITGAIMFCIIVLSTISILGLVGIMYAQFFQSLFLLISSSIILSKTRLFKLKLLKVEFTYVKLFFTYGKNFQFIAILTFLFEPTTKYFLNRFFNIGMVGSYDIVNRLTLQLRSLIGSGILAIVPIVTKQYEEKILSISPLYVNAFRGAALLSGLIFGLLISISFSFPLIFGLRELTSFQILLLYMSVASILNILSIPAYAVLLGLGKFKYILISHLTSTGLNAFLFLMVHQFMNIHIMLLPTFLAISISSIFLIHSFQKEYIKNIKLSFKADFFIHLSNLVFPIGCAMLSIYNYNEILLLSIAILHGLVVLLLVFKHKYLMSLKTLVFG